MVRPCFIVRSDSDIYFTITLPIINIISFRTCPGNEFNFKSHSGIYYPGYKLYHDASLSRPKFGS